MESTAQLLPLALQHHQAGRLKEAERIYRQILAREPNHADALHLTGVLAQQVGRHELAIQYIQSAICAHPQAAVFHLNLGEAYRTSGQNEQAIESYRRALELEPGNPAPHVQIGHALKNLGQHRDAAASYHAALELTPDLPSAYKGLGQLAAQGLYAFDDVEIDRMKQLLSQASLPPVQAAGIHFALGDWFHRQQQYDRAFDHYQQANQLSRQSVANTYRAFDAPKHVRLVDQTIAAFDTAYFDRVRGFGQPDPLPVFVVGMPRSGTTLVEQILASHHAVVGAGELKHLSEIAIDLQKQLDPVQRFPACLPLIDRVAAQSWGRVYLDRIQPLSQGADRVVDKMPVNFLYLGLIATILPSAKIVHCRRNALDVCFSCYCQSLKDDYTSNLEDLALYFRQYERVMDHWRATLPLPFFEVQYEELVENQESQTRALVEFCELPWDERCLSFYENTRAVRTASKFQVRQPMYRSSVGRWKKYEQHLQPLILALASPSENDSR